MKKLVKKKRRKFWLSGKRTLIMSFDAYCPLCKKLVTAVMKDKYTKDDKFIISKIICENCGKVVSKNILLAGENMNESITFNAKLH